jgi:hypothetical protein
MRSRSRGLVKKSRETAAKRKLAAAAAAQNLK